MTVALSWRSAIRKITTIARAIGRFFGPFPPAEPGAIHTPGFQVHASYGRFVFSMHALAPRGEALGHVDVHDAFATSGPQQANECAQDPAERVVVVLTPCQSQVTSTRHDVAR